MRLIALTLALALNAPAFAAPAHVHGEARLEIAVDGDNLSIHLESPLDGLLGFERAPRTPAEKQAMQAMKTTLEAPEHLFQLPAAAGCTARPAEVESAIFSAKAAAGHLDLDADYRWQCARPVALRAVEIRLFAEFPRLKLIKVDFVGPTGQKSGRLTPQQPSFAW
ncbi:DUF2796 domain-containing protein [Azonexus sp. IMCC34839]|uniref:DUF2796 domain-containing protein n=1 Tax=Azonexus sp. IMCC34839 TaxID=3133695 RepID=UPI00399A887A